MIRLHKILFFKILLSALLLSACAHNEIQEVATPVDGFQAFSSARDFDPPGQIFRVDENGNTWQVSTLNLDIKKGTEETLEISRTENLTIGGVLKTLGVARESLPLDVKANISKIVSVKLSSLSAEREFVQDDSGLYPTLSELFSQIPFRENNTYYIIRETISTKAVNFSLSRNWVADSEINAEIKKIVDANANADWSDSDAVTFNKNFVKPMRLWYKAEKITLKDSLGVGPSNTLKFQLKNSPNPIPNLDINAQEVNP